MSRTVPKMLLLTLALVAMTLAAGCSKQEPADTVAGGPSGAGTGPSGSGPEAAGVAGKTLGAALAGVQRPDSFEMTMAESDGGTMAMLVKGNWDLMRMETDDGFVQMDRLEGVTYAYSESENTAMKMPMSPDEQAAGDAEARDPLEGYDLEVPIIGEEDLDGDKCWTAEVTPKMAQEGQKEKVWVLAEHGLPRRIQTGDTVVDITYSRINELTDADFAMPEGAKIVDMSEMMPPGAGG